jgi:hypothetical protein
MSESGVVTLAIVGQCVRCLFALVGLATVYLGYRLFAKAGARNSDVALEAPGFKASLQRAAPGSCFALFGSAVIITSFVSKVFELNTAHTRDLPPATSSADPSEQAPLTPVAAPSGPRPGAPYKGKLETDYLNMTLRPGFDRDSVKPEGQVPRIPATLLPVDPTSEIITVMPRTITDSSPAKRAFPGP